MKRWVVVAEFLSLVDGSPVKVLTTYRWRWLARFIAFSDNHSGMPFGLLWHLRSRVEKIPR